MKVITENKKAFFDYSILDKFEAGLVLTGQEVKSIRLGRASLRGSYVVGRGEEFYLAGVSIPAYQPKNAPPDYNPQRARKLLLKKSEIKYLMGKQKQKTLTLIPLKIYTKGGRGDSQFIKLEFAVAKTMKKTDKREVIKKREIAREILKEMRSRG